MDLKPNSQLKQYSNIFDNLTKHKTRSTMFPIVTIMITYDSTRAITVTKKDEREYWVKMYDLESYEQTFEERISGSFIRTKEVSQNSSGEKYAIVFIDDGNFRLRYFDKVERSEEEIQQQQVNINKLLGINNYTMPIYTFTDPFITCCFITDDLIFCALFYNSTLEHYHFIYNTRTRKLESGYVKTKLNCTKKNFPYKSFYNEKDHLIHLFYR